MKRKISAGLLLILIILFLGVLQKTFLEVHNNEIVKVENKIVDDNNRVLIKEVKDVVYVVKTKEIKTKEIHDENSAKIEQAKGAENVIDDQLISTINDGLCRYKDTVGCTKR